jgi:uncharacterized protein YndB with AHSA1/START domain
MLNGRIIMHRNWLLVSTMAATLTVGPQFAADRSPDKLAPIDIEVRLPGRLADVWDAWTTNAGAQKWFAPKTNIELRSGGPFEILFMPDNPPGQRGAEDLKILAYLPQEMLTFEWNAPPQFARARAQRTWVVVRLTDAGDGFIRVRVSHAGFAERAAQHPDQKEEWEQVRDYFSKAWPRVLDHLRAHFANSATDDSSRQVTEGIVEAPLEAVWAALTTKAGMESWMVAHAEIDLKVGGRMLTHYGAAGVIGDPNTIENRILAYEPLRMLAIKVGKPPENFPFKEAIKNVWHVLTLEAAGPARTRLREVGLGYGSDDESQKLRAFFEKGNAYTLKKLQEHFAK